MRQAQTFYTPIETKVQGAHNVHPGVQKVDKGEKRYTAQAHKNQLANNTRLIGQDNSSIGQVKGGRPK